EVIGRSLINRQQSFERDQRTLAQQLHVTRDGGAEPSLLSPTDHFKSAEIFGEPLVEPGWKGVAQRYGAAARQRMYKFVKDDRIRTGLASSGGQRDVGGVTTRLKMSRDFGRFPLIERLERLIRQVVFEDDDGDRDRRVDSRRREDLREDLREGFAELLQAHPCVA